jgi:hypothetical protein
VLGSSLCEPRKPVLGLRAGGGPSMELTAPHRESGGALAGRTPAGPGLATNTLPVWAVKPWFGVVFHCAQLSSVYGVLLYPIVDGFTRHAWLGPRTAAPAKSSNASCAQATPVIGPQYEVQCPRPLAPCLSFRYWAKTVIQSICSEGLL